MLRAITLSAVLLNGSLAHAGIWDQIVNVFVGQEEVKAPEIKVLIISNAPSAMLEVKGSFNVYDPYKNQRVSTNFKPKKEYIESKEGGIVWGEEFPGVYQVKLVPDDPQTSILVNGIEYKGNVYVYDLGGSLSFINEVDIEDYVTSVLSPIFTKSLSKETMNAIAIAARTNAYHLSTHSQNNYWHVDGTKTGYLGYAVTKRSNGVDRAVFDTRYMVMNLSSVYSGDQITTFPNEIVLRAKGGNSVPQVSIDEVERLAQRGAPADRILGKLFPNTTISLTHSFEDSSRAYAADFLDENH